MDVQAIHEMLKQTLSPEDYIKLLKLMIKDIEIIVEWGKKRSTFRRQQTPGK